MIEKGFNLFTGNKLEMISTGFLEYDSGGVIIRKISWTGTYEYFNPENEIAMTGGSGLLIFKKNGKYGFKDQRGRIVIANQYEAAKAFHNRLASIKINNKCLSNNKKNTTIATKILIIIYIIRNFLIIDTKPG